MIVKLIYAGFVGLFTVFVVGVGIATFYAGPEAPEYPSELGLIKDEPTDEQVAIQEQYDEDWKTYDELTRDHNRNSAMIALGLAVLILALGVTLSGKLNVIDEGLLFGGLFTLFYSSILSFGASDEASRFFIMLLALGVALGFGYWKFVLPTQKKPTKK